VIATLLPASQAAKQARSKRVEPRVLEACVPHARLTLTLTAVVEVDVAVDVEPIVDLDVDRRVRSSS
jgi:hypothetical protein